jgi:hypothetical protein
VLLAGELVNMVIAQNSEPVPEDKRCITKFIVGHQTPSDELDSMPSPYVITDHIPEQAAGLDPDAEPERVPVKPVADWLPDLALGAVGMPMKINMRMVCLFIAKAT